MGSARAVFILVMLIGASAAAFAQPPAFGQPPAPGAARGAVVFKEQCASCHEKPAADSQAPIVDALRTLTPEAVNNALTVGSMRLQGAVLPDADRRAVTEFLTGRWIAIDPVVMTVGRCTSTPPMTDIDGETQWNGWGAGVTNTRFQPANRAGLSAAQVPKLTLKWAFGFPGATSARGQPSVIGGRVFVANENGAVYALDAKTGCFYWAFRAQAGVRTAIALGPRKGAKPGGYVAYFADVNGTAYGVDALSGQQIWVRKIEDHPGVRISGSPTLYDGVLYVPTAGVGEEGQGGRGNYECCTFRGAVTALDANTGALVWKSYTIPQEPRPRAKNKQGVQTWGPSGGGIWAAPTIDAKRGAIYVSTGNGYSDPPQPTTDAVVALDLKTGTIRWSKQTTPNDVWTLGCPPSSGPDNPNCPEKMGPDYDFSASPTLTRVNGRDLLVIPQKSGMAYALDPDKNGEIVWEYRAGQGSGLGGVWGSAVDDQQAYIAVADFLTKAPGGLHAVRLDTGQRAWFTPPAPALCGSGRGCNVAQGAAVTAIPGVVFSASLDGGLRAYSTKDGSIVWTFDTNRDFPTVNGVQAKGGSMDGPGPVIAGGMLYVNSGVGGLVGRPGNVLLAFGVD
jgi:polyvinyl alcohol dehydrogenase (cytochrome)